MMDRRKFVNKIGIGLAATALPASLLAKSGIDFSYNEGGEFEGHSFPKLPYAYNALEPYIDKMTMEIHYDRHHRGYYNKFIAATKGTELENMPLSEMFSKISSLPVGVRNSGGGYYNHTLFWNNMTPEKTAPSKELNEAIEKSFGSIEKFKEDFSSAASTRFGSGWAWLVLTADSKLKVSSTANQDNPLMDISDIKGFPLLALDVWEHAYYLKYQNKRGDYIDAFWNVVNWNEVSKRFAKVNKA